jgi:prolyl-tRNA synthetase
MRMSAFFGTTLREAPADASSAAAALLARASYLRGHGNGLVSWLPLGQRALARVSSLLRAEAETLGAQDVVLPGVDDAAAALGARDYQPAMVADIALAPEEAEYARCGDRLQPCHGILVGTPLHEALSIERAGAVYQDRDGREQPVRVLGFRFDTGRALEAAADACHDKAGLRLPLSIAPFDLHVISLGGPGTEAIAGAERLAAELEAAGISVLFDDRAESPGVTFADADLMGVPFRVTVSARALAAGGVELKRRDADERVILPAAEACAHVRGLLETARSAKPA